MPQDAAGGITAGRSDAGRLAGRSEVARVGWVGPQGEADLDRRAQGCGSLGRRGKRLMAGALRAMVDERAIGVIAGRFPERIKGRQGETEMRGDGATSR